MQYLIAYRRRKCSVIGYLLTPTIICTRLVVQRGADVILQLLMASGEKVGGPIDSPNGREGPEPVSEASFALLAAPEQRVARLHKEHLVYEEHDRFDRVQSAHRSVLLVIGCPAIGVIARALQYITTQFEGQISCASSFANSSGLDRLLII